MTNKELGKLLAKRVFDTGTENLWGRPNRMAFKYVRADRSEIDGGGLCEGALADWLAKELDAARAAAGKTGPCS